MSKEKLSLEEAVDFLFELPDDSSEISDIEDEDDNLDTETTSLSPRIGSSDETRSIHTVPDSFESHEPSNTAIETSLDDNVEKSLTTETSDKTIEKNQPEDSNNSIDSEIAATVLANSKRQVYRWRKKEPPTSIINHSNNFSLPPGDSDTSLPADYFAKFFDDKIFLKLVEETNLFSVQKCSTNINTNLKEMQQFFGTNMLMSVVKMPKFEIY